MIKPGLPHLRVVFGRAFVSNRVGHTEVYGMKSEGSEQIRLAHQARELVTMVRKGAIEQAIQICNESKKTRPREELFYADAMNGVGEFYLVMNRAEEAIEIFKLNLDAYPDSAPTYHGLVYAYLKLGKRELAIEYYQKSLELYPNDAEAAMKLENLK